MENLNAMMTTIEGIPKKRRIDESDLDDICERISSMDNSEQYDKLISLYEQLLEKENNIDKKLLQDIKNFVRIVLNNCYYVEQNDEEFRLLGILDYELRKKNTNKQDVYYKTKRLLEIILSYSDISDTDLSEYESDDNDSNTYISSEPVDFLVEHKKVKSAEIFDIYNKKQRKVVFKDVQKLLK